MHGNSFLEELFGKDIAKKVGDTIGMTIEQEYTKAAAYGFHMDKTEYYKRYDEKAAYIYSKANITRNLEKLAQTLLLLEYTLGVVSSSRKNWIDTVISKLSFKKHIDYVISLSERQDLKPKPQPDGYREAIQKLGATPKTTIILEDSNSGILSAKRSGAFVIGLQENLIPGYKQQGADVYAKTMDDVIQIVQNKN
jgi:HAD superfamily hydrolase (TIGR01509 family)